MSENILDIARRVRDLSEWPVSPRSSGHTRNAALQLAAAVERMATQLDAAYSDLCMAYDFLTKPEHYGTDPVAWMDEGMSKVRNTLRELGIPLEEAGDE